MCDAIKHTSEIEELQICEVADRVRQLLDFVHCDVNTQMHAHCNHKNHTPQPERLEIAQLRDRVWNDDNLVVAQIQPSDVVLLSDLIPFFDGRLCCDQPNDRPTRNTKTKIAKTNLEYFHQGPIQCHIPCSRIPRFCLEMLRSFDSIGRLVGRKALKKQKLEKTLKHTIKTQRSRAPSSLQANQK